MVYACILHNETVLTEHIITPSLKTADILQELHPHLDHTLKKRHREFTAGPVTVYALVRSPSEFPASQSSAGNLSFLVFAHSGLGERITFGFLSSVEKKFFEEFDPATTDFAELPVFGCASFNGTLKRMLTTESGKQDALRAAQSELDQVNTIMRKNVEAALERGGQISTLVDKTDRLGTSAQDFRVRSRGLRRRMWFKNVKLMILLGVVVIFLVYLLIGMICGLPGWSRCVSR